MKVITYDKALELLREVAAGEEGYVYSSPNGDGNCINWTAIDGERVPSCIVGHVFDKIGVLGEVGMGAGFYTATSQIRDIRFTDKASALLSEAQCRQDGGNAWGEAISMAENYATGRRAAAEDKVYDGEEEY